MNWRPSTGDIVLDNYHWPRPRHIAAPLESQVATVSKLTQHPRFFVLNDIGTGKTFAALWAFGILRKYNVRRRALIVAPLATLENAWKPSIPYIQPDMSRVVQLYDTTAPKRRERLASEWEIALINPDGLHIIADDVMARGLDLIIVDESTAFKTWRSRRTKALRRLNETAKGLWLMSGDPRPESPMDLWAQVKILDPTRVPALMTTWRERTMVQVSKFRWVPRESALDTMAKCLEGISVRYTRDECMDLLPTVVDMQVDATADYKRFAKEVKQGVVEMGDAEVVARNAASVLSKLVQAGSGAVKGKSGAVVDVDCTPRTAALDSLIAESSHPVIVYAVHRAALDKLAAHLHADGTMFVRVDGDVGPRQRQEAFDAIQTRQAKVLIAQPDAMAHGITLTEASVIVWWSLPFKRDTYNQANGRITRLGQRNAQLIVNLIGSHIERRILDVLRGKGASSGELLAIVQEWSRS